MPGLVVSDVYENSIAGELKLVPGDRITHINGQPLRDLIAFTYACADNRFSMTVVKQDGGQELHLVDKDEHDLLGLEFSQVAVDGVRRCNNNCCFCFVDQMPTGLRPSLYIKDDDWRLSVLQGNFVTLSNLKPHETQRIISEHLGPLYISVHTLNGQLRSQMMGNPAARAIKEQLSALARAKIEMHCQIVLCPGLNDGAELQYTLEGLAQLFPSVASVAAVPVGLTRFRKNLFPLRPYTKQRALELVRWAETEQETFRRKFNSTFFYLADEFYLLAEQQIPPSDYYDGFPQLENGVGLLRQFLDDQKSLPSIPPLKDQTALFVTGKAASGFIGRLAAQCESVLGLQTEVQAVENRFWGPKVTVAGLLTGKDVIRALQQISSTDYVFLPSAMFSADGLTLDGFNRKQMEQILGIELLCAHLPNQVWQQLAERRRKQ
ncbi:MAG: DUF512 domain-containing protein [Firmicutes bacterium]|nr:DUF512 domain-containing protein [Bacillota bacterium]